MSVTFDIRGMEWPKDEEGWGAPPPEAFVNLAQGNAWAFFAWLGIDAQELCGQPRARELAAVLRRLLADPEARAADVGVQGWQERNMTYCGRPAGRFVAAAEGLLALTEIAGDLGIVCWS